MKNYFLLAVTALITTFFLSSCKELQKELTDNHDPDRLMILRCKNLYSGDIVSVKTDSLTGMIYYNGDTVTLSTLDKHNSRSVGQSEGSVIALDNIPFNDSLPGREKYVSRTKGGLERWTKAVIEEGARTRTSTSAKK